MFERERKLRGIFEKANRIFVPMGEMPNPQSMLFLEFDNIEPRTGKYFFEG